MDADAQSLEEKAVLKEHWRRHATITHRTNLRTVLSVSSRVYDLLGLISPAVIQTRILQRIWRRRLDVKATVCGGKDLPGWSKLGNIGRQKPSQAVDEERKGIL